MAPKPPGLRRPQAAFGRVVGCLALPVHALPRHGADLGGVVALLQLGELPAALDAGLLAIVAGENHFGPGLARGGLSEAVLGEVLRYGIGWCQADDAPPVMRSSDAGRDRVR
jgi:hypothetical protein